MRQVWLLAIAMFSQPRQMRQLVAPADAAGNALGGSQIWCGSRQQGLSCDAVIRDIKTSTAEARTSLN